MPELKELLPILFERSSAAQTFWNFEIVVSLGILTVLATAPSFARSLRVRIVFIAAFLMFAAVNLNSLVWVTEQRVVLAQQVQQLLPTEGTLSRFKDLDPENPKHASLDPPSLVSVWVLHLMADAAVLVLLAFWPRLIATKTEAQQ